MIDKALTSTGAHNNKAVSALLNLDEVTIKDGVLDGLDKQLEALKESDGYLFKQSEESKPQPKSGVQITGGQPKPTNTGAKIDLLTPAIRKSWPLKMNIPKNMLI